MAFTDENYALIAGESERLAVSLVHFISSVIGMTDEKDIDSYISAMAIPRTKDFVARRRGNPAKRINLKFSLSSTADFPGSRCAQHDHNPVS